MSAQSTARAHPGAEVINLDAARTAMRSQKARRMTQAEVVAATRDRMLRALGLDFVLEPASVPPRD